MLAWLPLSVESIRGCGAAGSAPRSHRGGQGFESPQLHPEGTKARRQPGPFVRPGRPALEPSDSGATGECEKPEGPQLHTGSGRAGVPDPPSFRASPVGWTTCEPHPDAVRGPTTDRPARTQRMRAPFPGAMATGSSSLEGRAYTSHGCGRSIAATSSPRPALWTSTRTCCECSTSRVRSCPGESATLVGVTVPTSGSIVMVYLSRSCPTLVNRTKLGRSLFGITSSRASYGATNTPSRCASSAEMPSCGAPSGADPPADSEPLAGPPAPGASTPSPHPPTTAAVRAAAANQRRRGVLEERNVIGCLARSR